MIFWYYTSLFSKLRVKLSLLIYLSQFTQYYHFPVSSIQRSISKILYVPFSSMFSSYDVCCMLLAHLPSAEPLFNARKPRVADSCWPGHAVLWDPLPTKRSSASVQQGWGGGKETGRTRSILFPSSKMHQRALGVSVAANVTIGWLVLPWSLLL